MIPVCFIYDPETNERYLEILSKMTPHKLGRYKNIIGVTNIEDADFCVVVDTTTQNVPVDRTIYLQAHPNSFYYPYGYGNNREVKGKHIISLDNEPAFGEWWIDKSYNELKLLDCESKEITDKVCCIISNSRNIAGHNDRIKFLEKLCMKYPDRIDVYGRIKLTNDEPNIAKCFKGELGHFSLQTYWYGKEAILNRYAYSLELEALSSLNYFSERIYDSLLLWVMPVIWGCPNLERWLPKKSFCSIDIYKDGDEDKVIKAMDDKLYNASAIAQSRELLLDKYQIWAKIHNYINEKMIC